MSLRVGDHLVIKRNGKIVEPESEGYHEFEVVEQPEHFSAPNRKYEYKTGYLVKVEVVK
jgi:hypothetical protein